MNANLPIDAEPTVVNCYAFFDKVFPDCGLRDYTDGIYHGDPATPYDVAQKNQLQYLLDEVDCGPGVRVLEIGCGNGSLREAARERGAQAVGVTISPEQVERCTDCGLDVRLLGYRNLDRTRFGRFDAVIANGPIEHFVQPRDAADGRDDAIYRQMFAIFHGLIDPASPIGKFVNTTIHFVRRPDPRNLLASPVRFRWGSDSFHFAWLNRSFGGWYPSLGQLQQCSQGRFHLMKTMDGTYDYHLTSEEWLCRMKAEMGRWSSASRMLRRLLPVILKHPRQTLTMFACMLATQSWNWQFRTSDPPTRLLRQTWKYCPTEPDAA